MHRCMDACARVCICVCMHLCLYVCVYLHACVYACVYVCMCICMHVCMHVCMLVLSAYVRAGNKIGDNGAASLADSLRHLKYLTALHLDCGCRQCRAYVHMYHSSSRLVDVAWDSKCDRNLDILGIFSILSCVSDNRIGNIGVACLACELNKLTNLRSLTFRCEFESVLTPYFPFARCWVSSSAFALERGFSALLSRY